MKTKKEIVESQSYKILDKKNIYTLNEFVDMVNNDSINSCDGEGFFHDGENETDVSVWDDSLKWNDIKDYPYVCWYNK